MLLLFAAVASAAGAAEAVNFVQNTNHFLYDGETAEIFPVVTIAYADNDYWVISAMNGQSVSGFIPVEDGKDLRLTEGKIGRNQLIKTAHYLRLYDKLKAGFSQQGQWLFTKTNSDFFRALAKNLYDEKFELTTLETELDEYYGLQMVIDDLRDQLDEMEPLVLSIAAKIDESNESEANFFAKPDTGELDDFTSEVYNVFSEITLFDSKRADYRTDLSELKQGIATTDLSVETKRSLSALASEPQSMNGASSRITMAVNMEEKLGEIFTTAANQASNFSDALEIREKRSDAWRQIFGFDVEIVETTNMQGVDTLNSLVVNIVLVESNIYYWEEQTELQELQENWSKTIAYYENGSFDSAERFAEKSKENALKIFTAGFREEEPGINTDLLITGAVLLIIAVIIVYVLRNRDKFESLVSAQEEEEVPIHDWEEK